VRLGKRIEFGDFFSFLFSLCTTVGGRGIQGMVGPMNLHKCLYFGKKIECYECLHIETEGVATSRIQQTNHQLAHAVCSPDTHVWPTFRTCVRSSCCYSEVRATVTVPCRRPQHDAMQQILVLRIECFSVSFCGSVPFPGRPHEGQIRTSPFVKLKASSYCIHVGTDGRDDPHGFTAC